MFQRLLNRVRSSGFALPVLLLCLASTARAEAPPRLNVLFLGDQGHHRPADLYRSIDPALKSRGIDLTYTEKLTDLNRANLARYNAVLVYANIDKIEPKEAEALLDYVKQGGGFVPIHCASFCFRNAPEIVALIGAQFKRHGTGTFRDTVAAPDHPVMRGYGGFESWDETYVHDKHNEQGRTVLAYRIDDSGKEPWTWVRTEGKGRVFYTAWGHDQRTWQNPGFLNLLERGIRWAAGGDPATAGTVSERAAIVDTIPKMNPKREDVTPFEYVEAKIAYYSPGATRKGADAWTKMQKPLDPAESQKHLVVPEGFETALFAAEPKIFKPICMNWDERGRLWIAESKDYPNDLKPVGRGDDRISILEDTDHDGKADKFTVFADKLSIPTSMIFHKGGVIVHSAPDTLFFKDTDGDDKADERTVLFTGWGTSDTHAGPSNMRWGLDNWIWGIVGYSGFSGEVNGERLRFSQGFYRFKPDGSKLEFIRSTNNNSWGVGISEEGIILGSTANRNPSVYMPIPNRYYEGVRGWSSTTLASIADTHLFHAMTDKVRQVDHHGGYTAAAGHALYTARAYPPLFWNRTAFVAEPTGHIVGTFVLQREGSDIKSSNPFNLLASDDEWTAPILAEVGPDGQVWVIDWYNYIVQHNPTPAGFKTGKHGAYETDLRDKTHGRIYRVVHKAARTPALLTLKDAAPTALVAALKNDNMFWRLQAQRLLVERGKTDVTAELIALVNNPEVDAIGLNPAAIHALWALHGLGVLDGTDPKAHAAATAALRHRSAGVRMNAVKVLPRTAESESALLSAGLLDDPDAFVRLSALLALSEMPASPDVAKAVFAMLEKPENRDDRWIPEGATSAAATNAADFLKRAASSKAPAPKVLGVVTLVAEHLARSGAPSSIDGLAAALDKADRPVAEAIIEGLAKGWPKGKRATLTDADDEALARVLGRVGPGAKGQLVRLAAAWGSARFEKNVAEIGRSLLTTAADETTPEAERVAAAQQLVAFRPDDPTIVTELLDAISPRSTPTLGAGIIDALAESDAPSVGPAILERIGKLAPSVKSAALRVLLARPRSTTALLDGIEKGTVQVSDLSLDQKQALAAHTDPRIRARARTVISKGGGLPNADRQKVIEELSPVVLRKGDASLGKQVFTQQCAKCHTHSGEGGKVGPDLTGMAVHPKEELLINIIDPSRSVEGNFRQYSVATKDGRIYNGVLTSESKNAIELGDVEGKTHVIQRDDIEELQVSPKSVMPEGFEKQVPPESIANLLEFLTQRGKYLPLDLAKVATVVSTKGMFYDENSTLERLVFPDWTARTFEGVPFQLVDPKGGRVPNVVMLYSPNGKIPPTMPRAVALPVNAPVKALYFLSGVSGWGAQGETGDGSVSMIVRLRYADGSTEDHRLRNGVEFADYIGHFDVPGSKRAFDLNGRQIRYFAVHPKKSETIKEVELVKGPDRTAPVVMAVTAELAEAAH